jgi:hypothetical protein
MAEINAERWQNLQRQMEFEIGVAFKELGERWRNIFWEKEAQTYQAGKEWKLAQTQEGRLSWEPYPKPLETAVEELRAVVADLGTLPAWSAAQSAAEPTLDAQVESSEEYQRWQALVNLPDPDIIAAQRQAEWQVEFIADVQGQELNAQQHLEDYGLADRIVALQDRIDALEKEHRGLEHAQGMARERQHEQGIGY